MPRRCFDESCDLAHCAKCDTHYYGDGQGGLCYECFVLEEEEYDTNMRKEWEKENIFPGPA